MPVFLDTLEDAAFLLGDDLRAQSANAKARGVALKELSDIEGKPYGDIFDCAFAKLPPGCGKTEDCAGCSVRARVEDTFKTGTPHDQVPALIRRADGTQRRLRITTRRLAKGVLLTVHPDAG